MDIYSILTLLLKQRYLVKQYRVPYTDDLADGLHTLQSHDPSNTSVWGRRNIELYSTVYNTCVQYRKYRPINVSILISINKSINYMYSMYLISINYHVFCGSKFCVFTLFSNSHVEYTIVIYGSPSLISQNIYIVIHYIIHVNIKRHIYNQSI